MKNIRVAVAQYELGTETDENWQRLADAVKNAANAGAAMVLLPELGFLPYFCIEEKPEHFKLAQAIPGPASRQLGDLARKHAIVIITTVFEQVTKDTYFNTAVVLNDNGDLAGTYRKIHLPNDPGYYERFYFSTGNQGFVPVDTSIGRLGVMVCYDQWFPEAARAMTLAGAEILVYPSAIGFDPRDDEKEQIRQRNAWITIQKSHAIANTLPVLFSNRTGRESDSANTITTDFWGSSHIIGPFGEVLAKATVDQSEVITADIDPGEIQRVRDIWPFLSQRRVDTYE